MHFGVGDGSLRHPRHWPRLVNPFTPGWGEPYVEIVGPDDAGRRARGAATAAAGREAVLVSHQLPVWVTRLHLEGRRLWHDPRKRAVLAVLGDLPDLRRRPAVSLSYAEPAAALLPGAGTVAGA